MGQHAVFYYPYASFGADQSLLLKASALYFDKLYILDPLKASWAAIGPGKREADLQLLESEGVLQRVAPEEVLLRNDKIIGDAIERDLADPELRKLCAGKEGKRWGRSRWPRCRRPSATILNTSRWIRLCAT